MSFGYALANTAVNMVMGFRDRGWEKSLQDASDMIVNLGGSQADDMGQGLQVADMNQDAGFMDVFGHMTPPMTPMMPGRNAGFARAVG